MEIAIYSIGVLSLGGYLKLKTQWFRENLWLEEIDSDRVMNWVTAQNDRVPWQGTGVIFDRIKTILDSKEKIPYPNCLHEGVYYNFWQDETHKLGIWRRVSAQEYQSADPQWETVLDIDALNELEPGNEWRWKGAITLEIEPYDLVLVKLSRGGGDATVIREFSLTEKKFLSASENPFFIPEAKSTACYYDRDTLFVATDFGTSEDRTDSGYARQSRVWKRGTKLSDAKLLFTGNASDIYVSPHWEHHRGIGYHITVQGLTFYTNRYLVHSVHGIPGLNIGETPIEVPIPESADLTVFGDQFLIELRKEWLGYAGGSLLSIPAAKLLTPGFVAKREDAFVLFEPQDRVALKRISRAKDTLAVLYMENVLTEIALWRFDNRTHSWKSLVGTSAFTSPGSNDDLECWAVNDRFSDGFWMTTEGYATPTTLSIAESDGSIHELKQAPSFYDANDVVIKQRFATSKDGTQVPYFLVYKKHTGDRIPRKTLLYGYGGFEVSLTPAYSAIHGVGWIEKGYIYVVANIRGGGEFGPAWHQAALRENRCKAYEDFQAVAEHLIASNYTTKELLGAMGGSNGGLLMGNAYVSMYDCFSAIVCRVPLLDMKRYSHLLAGASWMVSSHDARIHRYLMMTTYNQAEYGNPDIADDWKFLKNYSAYHNIDSSKLDKYPAILFTTSTRDDRVHPSHARRMAKKLLDLHAKDVYLYENIEGGHGGASTNESRAKMWAMAFDFLDNTLH